jgi:hypothetical protein
MDFRYALLRHRDGGSDLVVVYWEIRMALHNLFRAALDMSIVTVNMIFIAAADHSSATGPNRLAAYSFLGFFLLDLLNAGKEINLALDTLQYAYRPKDGQQLFKDRLKKIRRSIV